MHIHVSSSTPYHAVTFEGGIYWDELAEICGDISRAAVFQGVVRFQGSTVHAAIEIPWFLFSQQPFCIM